MPRTVVVGGQYGDEGKGKIVSYLALRLDPEIVVRGGAGANAGHVVWHDNKQYGLRLVPCGFVNPRSQLLLGPGLLINPGVLLDEIERLKVQGRIGVDPKATVVTPEHIERDRGGHSKKIGTTGSGMGPAMSDRASRLAMRVSEVPELKPYLRDVPEAVNRSERVLVEGSQGFMLSNTYGDYPNVTVKDTTASTVAADVGLGPTRIDSIVMVIKAYTTRVGGGELQGEISEQEAADLGYLEHGTVTGRVRRVCPELHIENLQRAVMINGATEIALTKIDVRFKGNQGVTEFCGLNPEAKKFVLNLEAQLKVPITLIGTGPHPHQIIDRS